jgi:hypothetical protein
MNLYNHILFIYKIGVVVSNPKAPYIISYLGRRPQLKWRAPIVQCQRYNRKSMP